MFQIKQFISINDNGEISKGTFWKALKANVWGQIISYAKFTHCSHFNHLAEISDEILNVDHQHSLSPTQEHYNKRVSQQSDFDPLSRYRWWTVKCDGCLVVKFCSAFLRYAEKWQS